jgi:hypothetical protein
MEGLTCDLLEVYFCLLEVYLKFAWDLLARAVGAMEGLTCDLPKVYL